MTRPHNVMGMVRLRMAGNAASKHRTGQLSVPTNLMAHLRVGDYFKPEFTDEGILYRFVGDEEATGLSPPSWAKDRA